MKKSFIFVLLLVFGLFLFACNGNENEKTKTAATAAADSISLKKEVIEMTVGDEELIEVTSSSKDLVWAVTEGKDVITLTDTLVKANKAGTAKVTITIKGTDLSVTVTINVSEGEKTATPSPEKVLVQEIEIFGSEQMDVGASQTLMLDIKPSDATNKNVSWFSSDESVATVSDGLVEAKKAGVTVITVMANDGSSVIKSINITVKEKEITGEISIDAPKQQIYVNEKLQLTANATTDAANKDVRWEVDSTTKASINQNGVLTGLKRGIVIVTCYLEANNKINATVAITIYDIVTSIYIESTSLVYNIGDEETLFYELRPTSAETTVTWVSSDDSIMTVDQDGKIKAVGAGNVSITAKANDGGEGFGEIYLKVRPYVTDFTVTYKESMYVEETQTISLAYVPTDALAGATFASSDEAIAKVNNFGLVTARSEGEVTITITASDGGAFSKTITITIERPAEKVETTLASADVSNMDKGATYRYLEQDWVVGETVFSTIAKALETATKKVIVAPGEYEENVEITLGDFTLTGPNGEISPLTGTRNSAAIIKGTIEIAGGLKNVTITGLDFTDKGAIKNKGSIEGLTVSYCNIYDTNTDVKAWSDTRDYTVEAVFTLFTSDNMGLKDLVVEECKFNNITEKCIFLARNKNVTIKNCGFYNFKQDAVRGEGGYNYGNWVFDHCEFINDELSGCNGIFLGAVSGIDGGEYQTITVTNCTFKNIGGDATASKYHCAIALGGYYQEKGLKTDILYNTFENCPVYINARNNGGVKETFTTNINYNKFIGIPSDVYHRNRSVATDTETTNPYLSNMDYNLFIDNDGNVIADLSTVSDKIIELASCTNNYTSVADYEAALAQLGNN